MDNDSSRVYPNCFQPIPHSKQMDELKYVTKEVRSSGVN
jgi:hypothetical protein